MHKISGGWEHELPESGVDIYANERPRLVVLADVENEIYVELEDLDELIISLMFIKKQFEGG